MGRLRGRRVLTAVGVLAIAATGALVGLWQDDAEEAVDDAQQQAEDIGEDVQEQVDEAQQQADEVQEDVQEQVDEASEDAEQAADQAVEEAQEQADQALDETQEQLDEAQGTRRARSGDRPDHDLAPVAARVAKLDPAHDPDPTCERRAVTEPAIGQRVIASGVRYSSSSAGSSRPRSSTRYRSSADRPCPRSAGRS